jgi:6-phosphogluconolactonase (cycloisomerase 2 family)
MPASRTCHHPRTLQLLAGFTLPLLILAGCGGGGGGDGGGGGTPTPSTPVARFAYLANSGDDTISVFIANNTSGQLTHHGYALSGDGPNSLTIDPSGQFAYTTNTNSNDISLFTVNSLSGELTPSQCDRINTNQHCGTGGGTPVDITFNPNGRIAYVANRIANTITAHSVDITNGSLDFLSAQGGPVDITPSSGPRKIVLHPNGQVLYLVHDGSDDIGIYDISSTDGTLIENAGGSPASSGGSEPMDMVITSDGQYAFVANRTSGDIGVFTVDNAGLLNANGAAVSTGLTPHAMALDSTDQWLYVLSRENPGSVSIFEIQSDGTLLQINCSGGSLTCAVGSLPESITLDITGQFLSVANGADNTVSLFSIDQTSGVLSSAGTLSARTTPGALAYLSDPAEAVTTPRFAYVANFDGFSVSSYSINASSGSLTSLGTPTGTAGKPSAVTTDLAANYLYATNDTTDNVSVFSINSGSGALTEISGSPFSIETLEVGPLSISVDPSGRFAYVANSTDSLSAFDIDSTTGALSLMTGSPVTAGDNPSAVTIDPTGRFLYNTNIVSDNVTAFTIDTSTGALTPIGTYTTGDGPSSIVVDPSGRFVYVTNNGFPSFNVSAFSINPLTGVLSNITGSPFSAGNAPISITVDPQGKFVYVANRSTQNVTPYTINQTTGALTAGTNVATELNPQAIAIDPSGQYVYVANGDSNNVSGYSVNATSGELTSIGASVASGTFPQSIVTTATVQ